MTPMASLAISWGKDTIKPSGPKGQPPDPVAKGLFSLSGSVLVLSLVKNQVIILSGHYHPAHHPKRRHPTRCSDSLGEF